MSHEPYETLAAVYVVGALDGDDLAQFEAHLPDCAICQAAVRDAQDVLARAVLTAPPQVPPPDVRHALVRRVAGASPIPRRRWLPWALGTVAAAIAAAAFTGARRSLSGHQWIRSQSRARDSNTGPSVQHMA